MSSKEISNLVNIYMAGGNVSCILNKMIQEGVDPAVVSEAVQALNKAKAIKEGQKSITDGEVFAIKTHGTIEQIKADFNKKWMENGDHENIKPLNDRQVELYTRMQQDKRYPLQPNNNKLDTMTVKKLRAGNGMVS